MSSRFSCESAWKNEFFKNEEQLRALWSKLDTRKAMLEKLADAGFGREQLHIMQSLIDAEKSDLFEVLEYISFTIQPINREARIAKAQSNIFNALNNKQKQFLEFVLAKYIETGVEELDQEKLAPLLTLKYQALDDAKEILGTTESIRNLFINFQRHLREQQTAST